MKKLKIILMCILTLFVTGCSKTRTALSPEEFSSILKDSNYKILDRTDTIDYADAAYVVNSDAYDFAFVKGKRKYDIEGLFIEECKNVMNDASNKEYEKDLDSGDNFAYLKITTDEKFYYVSWIGDTYLYIKAPITRRDEFENLLDKLGY